MRILVTGATGFVGRHLVRLLDQEWPSSCEIFGSAFPDIPGPSETRFHHVDLRSANDVLELVNVAQPDWVCHLAAVSSVRRSWHLRNETIETNVLGTLNLLEAVKNFTPAARVLFVSSSDVYQENLSPAMSLNEDAPTEASSPYALSKIAGEMVCLLYEKMENLDVVIARPFHHTGPGQSEAFVCSDWASQLARIESGHVPPVLKVGNLDVRRDFSDVRDVVRAYVLLLEMGRRGETYNVCSGKDIGLREVLDLLFASTPFRKTIHVDIDESRLKKTDLPVQVGSNVKISERTGWSPQFSMNRTLRDVLSYWRNKLEDAE